MYRVLRLLAAVKTWLYTAFTLLGIPRSGSPCVSQPLNRCIIIILGALRVSLLFFSSKAIISTGASGINRFSDPLMELPGLSGHSPVHHAY